MKPIIYIHGGLHKTGTSSIQNFLFAHRDELADKGYYYPLSGCLVNDQTVGKRHYKLMLELTRKENYSHWESLVEEIKNYPNKNIVISHENFFSPVINPLDIQKLLPEYQIKLIVYFRHPVDYIESCYREWVRRVGQYDKDIATFYKWRKSWLPYRQLLHKWDNTIGSENIIVRMFDRKHFIGGSIENDFLETIGLKNFSIQREEVLNTSLNSRQILLYLVRNRYFSNLKNIQYLENILVSDARDFRILDNELIDQINSEYYNDFLYVQIRGNVKKMIASKYEEMDHDKLFKNKKLIKNMRITLSKK